MHCQRPVLPSAQSGVFGDFVELYQPLTIGSVLVRTEFWPINWLPPKKTKKTRGRNPLSLVTKQTQQIKQTVESGYYTVHTSRPFTPSSATKNSCPRPADRLPAAIRLFRFDEVGPGLMSSASSGKPLLSRR